MSTTVKAKRKPMRTRKSRTGLWITLGVVVVLSVLIVAGALTWGRQKAAGAQVSGPAAPDFTVPTLDGETFTLSEHRGKPVILFAMAYWCGTCVPEAKALARLHEKYGDQVVIVALDVDPSSTPEALQRFRQWVGNPDYVWAFDEGNRVAMAYRIRSLDSTFIISPSGQIVYSDTTPTPYQTLERQIRRLRG